MTTKKFVEFRVVYQSTDKYCTNISFQAEVADVAVVRPSARQ